MTLPDLRLLAATAALAMAPACTFHSVATHWNGRVGADGHPVYVRTSTNIGINLGIVLPILGKTTIDEMIEEMTAEIASHGGDNVRVFETSSENYWYGLAPVTWVATPVITAVSVDYRPSPEEVAKMAEQDAGAHRHAEERREADNAHILPDSPKR